MLYSLYQFYDSKIKGRKTYQYFEELKKTQFESLEKLQQRQVDSLRNLLIYANDQTNYYKNIFQNIEFDPNHFESFEDIQKLPILTKDLIRENFEDLLSKEKKDSLFYKSTGGSTGKPLKLAHDKQSYEWRMAVYLRGYSWANAEDGKKTVYIWGGDIGNPTKFQQLKKDIHSKVLGRRIFNSFYFSEEKMRACAKFINDWKPDAIVGYARPLYNFTKYLDEQQIKMKPVENIVTGAEKVYDFQREMIEKVFQGKVFNTYGCREFMLIASECEKHEGLHVNLENIFLEILDDNHQPVKPGEIGHIVITDLHNYGLPFIRYKNGDLGIMSEKKCSCGRTLPLMKDVVGRALDMIRFSDGTALPGEFFPHMMKEFEAIKNFQVVQESFNLLKIKMVLNEDLSSDRQEFLCQELDKVLKNRIQYQFEFVDEIPLTKTGKHRVTISNL